MKEIKIEQCPFCGGTELFETRIASYGSVSVNRVGALRSVPLFATVCRDCGSVVRTFCREPEKLFPKKERRDR